MYSFESRVRYSETDSSKRLTLPSLLDYFQDCCTFESESLDRGVDYLRRENAAWLLSSWQVKIAGYPKLGEKIKVNTWPYDFKSFYGYRNFSAVDAEGKTLAEANSIWVFMDLHRMRPVRIPAEMTEAYRNAFGAPLSGEWEERRITVLGGGEKKSPIKVARFHIDTNHHMNNGKYILAAQEYLPKDFVAGGLRAEYKKAALLGDLLYPSVSLTRDRADVILADENEKPYAVVQFFRKDESGAL